MKEAMKVAEMKVAQIQAQVKMYEEQFNNYHFHDSVEFQSQQAHITSPPPPPLRLSFPLPLLSCALFLSLSLFQGYVHAFTYFY